MNCLVRLDSVTQPCRTPLFEEPELLSPGGG
jgi:hypothetical protein